MNDTPSKKREKAEQEILRNMRLINAKRDHDREAEQEVDEKKRVMNVLTRFLKLKEINKIH